MIFIFQSHNGCILIGFIPKKEVAQCVHDCGNEEKCTDDDVGYFNRGGLYYVTQNCVSPKKGKKVETMMRGD